MWKIALVLALPFGCSDSTYGDSCDFDFECNGIDTEEICKDGNCQCHWDLETYYSSANGPKTVVCNVSLHNQGVLRSPKCNAHSCGVNALCQKQRTYGWYPNTENDMCVCKEGFLHVDDECREVVYQKVLMPCNIPKEGPVLWCNSNEYSYCDNGTCICFDTYFANTTSGRCEPKANYLKAHLMSVYRVTRGHYCRRDKDCEYRFVCKNYKCDYPPPIVLTSFPGGWEDTQDIEIRSGGEGKWIAIGMTLYIIMVVGVCVSCLYCKSEEDGDIEGRTSTNSNQQPYHSNQTNTYRQLRNPRQLHRFRIPTVFGNMTNSAFTPSTLPNRAALLPFNSGEFQPSAPSLPTPPRESAAPPQYEVSITPPPPYEEIILLNERHCSTMNSYQSTPKISDDSLLGESLQDDAQKQSQERIQALARYPSNAVEPRNDETGFQSSATSSTGSTTRSSASSRTSTVTLSATSARSSEGPTDVSM